MESYWYNLFSRRAANALPDYQACDYASQRSFDWRRQNILNWIGPHHGRQILDVGCGPGAFVQPLAAGNRVVGVDFVPAMLSRARERGLHPVQAHAAALPLPDEIFDLVLCIEVLQCVDDWHEVVGELIRVVKPGGTLVIATLTDSAFRHGLYRLLACSGRSPDRQPRLFSIAALMALLETHGMNRLEILTLYYPLRWYQFSTGDGLLQNLFSSSFAVRATKKG